MDSTLAQILDDSYMMIQRNKQLEQHISVLEKKIAEQESKKIKGNGRITEPVSK